MNISTQLIFTILFLFSIQTITQAQGDIDAPYGPEGTRFPITIFIQKLKIKNSNRIEVKKIIEQLTDVAMNSACWSDREIANIIDVINDPKLTFESKIIIFSQKYNK